MTSLKSGDMPVLATPAMMALMKNAAMVRGHTLDSLLIESVSCQDLV